MDKERQLYSYSTFHTHGQFNVLYIQKISSDLTVRTYSMYKNWSSRVKTLTTSQDMLIELKHAFH